MIQECDKCMPTFKSGIKKYLYSILLIDNNKLFDEKYLTNVNSYKFGNPKNTIDIDKVVHI